MSTRQRPILTPPIQVGHIYYRLTRILVWAGFSRYFQIHGLEGLEDLPPKGTPTIFLGNHQNGMMDPMPFSGFVPQQIHWLTRADVFWNKVSRHILYGYNQLPIYRQRDRVEDIRMRNDVIFDVCVDRMHAGAAMGIFPEGNHNPFPSLRPLKGGLAEMLARSARRHPALRDIQVVPIGLDYEDYVEWRRGFRMRIGQPVPFADLLLEDGTIDKSALNERVSKAMREVMVDLQPAEAQPFLHHALRALRTTERSTSSWAEVPTLLQAWAHQWANEPQWAEGIKKAHGDWMDAWCAMGNPSRPEAWGWRKEDARSSRNWLALFSPLAILAHASTWPAMALVKWWVKRSVRKPEFVSTMRLGYGIVMLPLWWVFTCALAAALAPEGLGWLAAGATWVWGQAGSRFYGWHVSAMFHEKDAKEGQTFWNDDAFAEVRSKWEVYLKTLQQANQPSL